MSVFKGTLTQISKTCVFRIYKKNKKMVRILHLVVRPNDVVANKFTKNGNFVAENKLFFVSEIKIWYESNLFRELKKFSENLICSDTWPLSSLLRWNWIRLGSFLHFLSVKEVYPRGRPSMTSRPQGERGQGFCDNSSKASVLKSEWIGRGGLKIA